MPQLAQSARTASWVAALDGADDDDLMALLTLRPDLAWGGPTTLAEIAERMVTATSVRAYFERADMASRQVLEVLCVAPAPTSVDTLAHELGTSPEALSPVLARLAAAGMLLREGSTLVANPGSSGAISQPCLLGPPAPSLLVRLTVSELTAMAGHLGARAKGDKNSLIDQICQVLGDAGRLGELLATAPADTGDLVIRAAHEWPAVELAYGVTNTARSARTPAGWCLVRGLLLGTGWASAVMPREVAIALRGGKLFPDFSPHPPASVSVRVDTARTDSQATDAARRVVNDVVTICQAWGETPAKMLQGGGLGIREVRRIAKLVGRPDDVAARVIELAGIAGLISVEGEVVMPTADYDRWVEEGSAARWNQLCSTWLASPSHLSLPGAISAQDKVIAPLLDWRPEPVALVRRSLVMAMLLDADAGAAVERESVIIRAQWLVPALWHGGPARPHTLISWFMDEAELLGLTSRTALSSFGRSLVEGDPGAATDRLATLAPPVVSEVILQADLTAMIAGEPPPSLQAELGLLADVESTGSATVWRFSETTLRRAFDAGRSSEQILALLGEHAPRGVPQPLAYLIQDLGRRFGQARLGPAACYLRCDDASLLAEIIRSKRVAALGLRPLAPTVAITDQALDKVLATLRNEGYLPAAEQVDGALVVSRPSARRASPTRARPGAPSPDAPTFDYDYFEPGDAKPDDVDDKELRDLISHLRKAPAKYSPPSRAKRFAASIVPEALSPTQLLEDSDSRPTHIAKAPAAVTEMLQEACEEGWPVRLCYVNGRGEESEDFAEVLDVGRRSLRVQYLSGRRSGAELVPSRIRWARVLTEAEEELHLL